uniref:Uncharacterized protein n=1 Tax=Globisporangium ultimum (strain ATCC 200006 / CBS 805.95 / DAOM BR144) TaxID=431595 RepID=K3WVD5_GLOUD
MMKTRSASSEEERVPECTSEQELRKGDGVMEKAGDGKRDASNQEEEELEARASGRADVLSSGTSLKQVLKKLQANEDPIRELDLSEMSEKYRHKLKASGGVLVARVMEINRTVKRLVLPNHGIGDDGALAMADMLRMNAMIQYLDLYGNGITDVGCKGIADALYGHDSLQHLAMWGNAIGDEGAKAIAQALQVNRSLTYVGLVDNKIGEEGARALLEAVQMNPMIQSLGLAANQIPSELQQELNAALAANKAAAMTHQDDVEHHATPAPAVSPARAPVDRKETSIIYDSEASDSSTDEEATVTEKIDEEDEDDDDDAFWV